MINTSWVKRSYAAVSELDQEDDPGGGRGGNAARARLQGQELQREAARKKFYFQQKMALEGKRKVLGKGNIITFLTGDTKQVLEFNDFNKILRIGGFTPDQVVAIKKNDFRANQIEVLFKSDVEIDTLKVEEKLRKDNIDILVGKFDHMEEFLIILRITTVRKYDSFERENIGLSFAIC